MSWFRWRKPQEWLPLWAHIKECPLTASAGLRYLCCQFVQVKDELAQVEDTNLGDGGNSDSFARVFYSREAEYAVNEQIK